MPLCIPLMSALGSVSPAPSPEVFDTQLKENGLSVPAYDLPAGDIETDFSAGLRFRNVKYAADLCY